METSILRPTRPAINMRADLSSFRIAIYIVVSSLVGYCIVSRAQTTQTVKQLRVLDLTEKVLAIDEDFSGIPGESFGGPIGQSDRSRYQVPIEIKILSVSDTNDGDFTIDVLIRNTGTTEFDLPSSKNLTSIERPGNKGQRLFFFHVRPLTENPRDVESMEVVATGGSITVPNSFRRLAPGESLRVLLPAHAEIIKRVLKGSTEQLEVRVECNEWQLEDTRYFIKASSNRAVSKDVIKFALRNGKPVVLQP